MVLNHLSENSRVSMHEVIHSNETRYVESPFNYLGERIFTQIQSGYMNMVWLFVKNILLGMEKHMEVRKGFLTWLLTLEMLFSNKASPVKIAMLDKYRIENTFDDEWEYVIQSYRHYYLEGKWKFAEWRMDRRPDWFPVNQYEIKYNEWALAFNKAFDANIQLKEV